MRFSEFTEDEVLRVRKKIEQVLREIGMRVEMPKVREMCAAAGAKVEGDRVYFPPEVLSRLMALVPKTYEARSPYGRSWTIGGGRQYMTGIVMDPWINDPAGVRRPAMDDLLTNLALMEHYDDIVMVSRMDFPVTDHEGDISSYKALEQFFLNFDKHIMAYCTSVESLKEYFEIGQTILGEKPLKDSKLMSVAVATLSPMALTDVNCRLLLETVKYNFPIIPTTCPMAGTTSPYTLIGTFIQGMAEVIGLCAIIQAVNPGNPYIPAFGPSVSSLQDGHDMYYTVEKPLWKIAATQITKSYGLPYMAECGGNTPAGFDMQCGAESMFQMLSAVVDIVGQEAEILIPERSLVVLFDESLDPRPFLKESALAFLLQREANGIVPKGIGLDLVAGALGNGPAPYIGVHPAQRHAVHLGPEQAVRMHGHLGPAAGQVAFDNGFERLAIFAPDLPRISAPGDVLLKGHRHIKRGLHLRRTVQQALLIVFDQVVEDLLEFPGVVLGIERQSGQGVQGLAQQSGIEPGVSGHDLLAAAVVADQQVGLPHELVVERSDGADVAHRRLETAFQARLGDRLTGAGGEHNGFTLGQFHLETARHEEVLPAVEAAAHLIGVRHALVPARRVLECRRAAQLQVQVGKSIVKVEGDAAFDLLRFRAGVPVLVRQVVHASERQEGLQGQFHPGGRVDQFVLDQDLVAVLGQDQAFAEDDLADLVHHHRHRIGVEVDDVLVSARLVYVSVAMDAQVEPLAPEGQALVQRRKQHVTIPAEPLHRSGQQAVITAGVAGHDGRIAVRAPLAREQDLPLERVGQIHEFRLVELQKCHIGQS